MNPLYTYINSPRNNYIKAIFSYQASFTGTVILEFGFLAKSSSKVWFLDDVSIIDRNASNSEMLVNGDFELGSLESWQVVCSRTNCGGTGGVIDHSDCHTGSYCYKGACRRAYDFLRQSCNVVNGRIYTLTYWIKTNGSLDGDGYVDIRKQ